MLHLGLRHLLLVSLFFLVLILTAAQAVVEGTKAGKRTRKRRVRSGNINIQRRVELAIVRCNCKLHTTCIYMFT
eukprot:m.105985 g.105985  ORF g.105985 m.105985 type:complete len:74 (+) comp37240_c1_seq6:4855-5076(+)